jgi:hypothetical protein
MDKKLKPIKTEKPFPVFPFTFSPVIKKLTTKEQLEEAAKIMNSGGY